MAGVLLLIGTALFSAIPEVMTDCFGSDEQCHPLAIAEGTRLQVLLERIRVYLDALSRIPQIALAAELIHVMGDNLARGAYILRKQFMREGHHLNRAVFQALTKPLGEANQRSR